MMTRKLVLALALLAFLLPARASSPGGGARAVNTLLRGEAGARPSAMGGAFTAVAEGPLALRYNPAGLADRAGWRTDGVLTHGLFAQFDVSVADINRSDVLYARNFADGGLGLGISYVDYGTMTRTTTANKTNAGTYGAYDLLFRAGYGRAFSERLALGAAIGVYQSEIDIYSTMGVVGDLGLLYRPGPDGLVLGASLRNIGSRAHYVAESEDLPLAVSLGGAWRVNRMLLASIDWEMVQAGQGALRAGIEVTPIDVLALRLGYDGRNEAGSGLTAGIGFRTGALRLDYAYVPYGDLGDAHRISAEWDFGPSIGRAPESPRAPLATAGRAAVVEATPSVLPARTPTPSPVNAAPPARPAVTRRSVGDVVKEGQEAASRGEDRRAEELFREALRLDPVNVTSLFNVASYRYMAGDYVEARRHYTTTIRLAPEDAEAWLYLGLSEMKLGRAAEARLALQKALQLDPSMDIARQALREIR